MENQPPAGEYSHQTTHSRGIPQSQQISSHDSNGERQRGGYGHQTPNIAHGNYPAHQPFSSQQHPSQARLDTFNMASLGGSLPEISYQNFTNVPSQRYHSSHPQQMYLQNMQQFPTAQPLGQNMAYNSQFQNQYSYATNPTPSPPNQLQTGNTPYQGQAFLAQQQAGTPFFIQQGQYGLQNQMYIGSNIPAQLSLRGTGTFAGDRLQTQQRAADFSAQAAGKYSGAASSTVRGPPRKPRQSGHAIWIGNLPPQTSLMSLVLHVCKETMGLESLFLISKSNCAFANFKDQESCTTAQLKIHDSRFQTVQLVSRLRRQSLGTPTDAVPTGPAALSGALPSPTALSAPAQDAQEGATDVRAVEAQAADDSSTPRDKFFIVKSLTAEDLELSVRNGIWATQSHNEETLNKAFEAADNVYLVFSANKSGEYFGYAKMISPINDDPAAAIEFAPKAHTVEDPELPKAISTPATEFAPKGRIIDDSARGTIFWEVERDDEDEVDGEDSEGSQAGEGEPSSPSKTWGKPFQVEWVSTTRLPFYRTRGLRNPWNSNREVKIARDGTELETAVGRRLIALFHRLPSPVASTNAQGMPLMGGYPNVRSLN